MQRVLLTQNNCLDIINKAKKVLENHGLVVFPSDTVYGLAVNALSERGVTKLYAFKNRQIDQAVSINVPNLNQAKLYFQINTSQEKLLKTLLPGPYTLILRSTHRACLKLEAYEKTLGMRIPNYWFTQALNQALPFPYTATSANLHGKGPHYSIDSLLNTLSDKKKAMLNLIIDYGKLPKNPPSTVINLTSSTIKILRQGQFSFKKLLLEKTTSPDQTRNLAKKLLPKIVHFTKKKPIVMILQGDLGTGKTVFTQGLGKALNCEPVVSPTYVISYEYQTKHSLIKKLLHYDLYRLDNIEDFTPLKIESELKPGHLLVFEWGEKLGSIFDLIKAKSALVLLINFHELSLKQREIIIYQLT